MAFPSYYRHGIIDFINDHHHLIADRSIVKHIAKLTPLGTKIDVAVAVPPGAASRYDGFLSKSDRFGSKPLIVAKRDRVGPGRYNVVQGNISEKQRMNLLQQSVRKKERYMCRKSVDSARSKESNIYMPEVKGIQLRSMS